MNIETLTQLAINNNIMSKQQERARRQEITRQQRLTFANYHNHLSDSERMSINKDIFYSNKKPYDLSIDLNKEENKPKSTLQKLQSEVNEWLE